VTTRVLRLGRTELTLFWRNRMAVFTALLTPAAMAAVFSQVRAESGPLSANAFMISGAIGFVLLFVVYYNLVVAYVARREELVLKRLRTGEVTDPEILAATALPAAAIALAQTLAMVAVGMFVFDVPVPVNGLLIAVGAAAGVAVFVLLAAVSTRITRTVEMAQLSTMPVLMLCMFGSGAIVPLDAFPAAVGDVARLLPLTPVIELIRLGWVGTTGTAAPVDFAGTFRAAAAPVGLLVAWLALGGAAVKRWFRWEPRR
jgi:ABC-2 type transport system permease protein